MKGTSSVVTDVRVVVPVDADAISMGTVEGTSETEIGPMVKLTVGGLPAGPQVLRNSEYGLSLGGKFTSISPDEEGDLLRDR